MKNAVEILKERRKELAVELTRIDKALAALEPEKAAPRVVTAEHRKAISEGLKRRHAKVVAAADNMGAEG
jgi:hypothetical protein